MAEKLLYFIVMTILNRDTELKWKLSTSNDSIWIQVVVLFCVFFWFNNELVDLVIKVFYTGV